MRNEKVLPPEIATAIQGLITPYGYNIHHLIASQQSDDATTEISDKVYITISEIEHNYSLSRSSIGRRIKSGDLKAIKTSDAKSSRVLVEVKSLKSWLLKCRCN